MGTLTITAASFANLPTTAPAGWPAGVAWPGGQSPNGTKSYTVSDADWIKVLTWAAASQITQNTQTPTVVTAAQILLAWLQVWINGTKQSVVNYFTAPAVPGASPTIT